MKDIICVSLDMQYHEALTMLNKLQGLVGWVKIGPALLTKEGGISLLNLAKSKDFKVFADFKFKDIPSVVAKGIKNLRGIADLVTVHIDGGEKMLLDAKDAAGDMLVIGVTLLTSLNWKDLQQFGIPDDDSEYPHSLQHVLRMVAIAVSSGIDGIVCSVQELGTVKQTFPNMFFVTPGLKMGVNECDYRPEQKRDGDPRWAYQQGSNLLVMGRDIYQAQDPIKQIECIERWCLGT